MREVKTLKAYAVVVENGEVTDVFSNNDEIQIDKDVITQKYKTLSSMAVQTNLQNTHSNVISTEEQCTYDCSTGKLTYTYIAYTEEDGVIVDNVFEYEV